MSDVEICAVVECENLALFEFVFDTGGPLEVAVAICGVHAREVERSWDVVDSKVLA